MALAPNPCWRDPAWVAPHNENPMTTTKITHADRQRRHEDRIVTIRLRMAIGRELEGRGITTSAAISEALGMPANEATKLLTAKRKREGDVELLQAVAARLGVVVADGGGQ